MKLDKIDKSRSFSKRLLQDFTNAMFALLQKKKLESITVGELCDLTNYPRSTFYNYFEDIYALMDYCWQMTYDKMQLNDGDDIVHDKQTLILFDKTYDYMEKYRSLIEKLIKHNPKDGAMMYSLNRFIQNTIFQMITECPLSYKYPMPYDMIALHYSNTVQMLLSACFLDKTITKEQATAYLDFLLGTLEKESTRR